MARMSLYVCVFMIFMMQIQWVIQLNRWKTAFPRCLSLNDAAAAASMSVQKRTLDSVRVKNWFTTNHTSLQRINCLRDSWPIVRLPCWLVFHLTYKSSVIRNKNTNRTNKISFQCLVLTLTLNNRRKGQLRATVKQRPRTFVSTRKQHTRSHA